MKKTVLGISVIVTLMFLLLFSTKEVLAETVDSGTCGDNLTYTLDSDGTLIISGTGEVESFKFAFKKNISKVIINEGATGIGGSAFASCSNLTEISIPDGVATIGNMAFNKCEKLKEIIIPDSVTSIGSDALALCSALEKADLGQGLVKLSGDMFNGCSSLKFLRIPDSVTSISDSTYGFFRNCDNLEEVVIGNQVQSIPYRMFYQCTGLKKVNIPDSVTSIGTYAFYQCKNLQSITIPDSVVTIEEDAFCYCSALEQASIGNGVTKIGYAAFDSCSNLTDLTIGSKVESIAGHGFRYCTSLKNLTIPASVTSIDNTAFENCSELERIIVESGNGVYDSRENCNAIIKTESNELMFGCKGTVMPDSVTSIGNYAFMGNNLTGIKIGAGVTSIGSYAFTACRYLESISIPDNVKSIGFDVFSDCNNLGKVEIGDGLTEISDYTFRRCYGLREVVFGKNVEKIGIYAFVGCKNLTRIKLPSKIQTIEEGTFSECSELKAVEIPAGVIAIGRSAFSDCTNLKDVYFLGNEAQWNKIDVLYILNNEALGNATLHLGEEMPGHVYGAWKVVRKATCTEDGMKERVCQECGHTESAAVPATGHKPAAPVKENEIVATLQSEGSYDSVVYCSVCKQELSRETIVTPILVIKDQTIAAAKTSYAFTFNSAKTQSQALNISGAHGTLSYTSGNAKVYAKDGKICVAKATPVGTYTINATAAATENGEYKPSNTITITVKVGKAANTIKATPATKKYKVAKVKKKAQSFQIKVTQAQGKVTYKSSNSKVKVTAKGKVTVKKGTKKGSYKITVTAAGNANYKKGVKTITVVVK